MTDTSTVAVIPTLGLSSHLDDLVEVLVRARVPTRLYVNGSVREHLLEIVEGWPHDGRVELVSLPDESIYAEWNHAAEWARELPAAYMLLLNDDVKVDENAHSLGLLREALQQNPTYGMVTVGDAVGAGRPLQLVKASHTLGNRYQLKPWCCAVRVSAWQDVDPGYQVWYGDDDMIWKLNETGWETGYLQGVTAEHYTSTTSQQLDWVAAAIHEDSIRWQRSRA